ncbi:MAG: lysylphosphatidylglycerol synthase transmembrane domain-containing protein [Actinomycetota bacterium]|nr:lysylphosphatidylglycerol synthase transmembrane domain-containing protein [Actinomycetota bacterium]
MTDNLDAQPEAPDDEKKQSRKGQIIATIVTIVTLVIVFAVVFPQLADYGDVWTTIQTLSGLVLGVLILATIANIFIYVWPFQAALPGIPYGPAFVVRQTSFTISNGIPGGGAIGLALQYSMLGGYGFGSGPATATIGITSVWNMLVTLALPVLAVLGLALVGDLQSWAIVAAVVGLVVVGLAIGLLVLVFRSEPAARRVGEIGDRLLTKLTGLVHKTLSFSLMDLILNFRTSTVDVVQRRAAAITLANVVQQITQFLILFIALRGIQADASMQTTLAEAFAAFAVGRLGSFIPLTPGGLGTVDAMITGILVAFGANEADALAATLVWRAATYFPQLFLGMGTFLFWRHGRAKRARAAA